MNERIHWFSVEGRPFCDAQNVWFQKYPDSCGPGLNVLCYIVNVSNPTCYEFKIHFPSFSLPLAFLSLFLFSLVFVFFFWLLVFFSVMVFGTLISGLLCILHVANNWAKFLCPQGGR